MFRIHGVLVCAVLVLLIHCTGFAATITWNSASGGLWFDSTKWTPSQIPQPTDTAVITLPGSYDVIIETERVEIAQLILGDVSGCTAYSGRQGLSLSSPACSLLVHENIISNICGFIHLFGGTVAMIDSGKTFANNGLIEIDSAGSIYLGRNHFINHTEGRIDIMGWTSISADWTYPIINYGFMQKYGPGPLRFGCFYRDSAGGSMDLNEGEMHILDFEVNGMLLLSPLTTTILTGNPGQSLRLMAYGFLDLDGSATITGDSGRVEISAGGLVRRYEYYGTGTCVISSNIVFNDWSSLDVYSGKLLLVPPDSSAIGATTDIRLGTELETSRARFQAFSSVTGGGTLTLNGHPADDPQIIEGEFPFSGNLRIRGGHTNFNPLGPATITIDSFAIDSGASFTSSVTINATVANVNGGSTNANIASNQYNWTAGNYIGSGGTDITVNPGSTLTVTGPINKVLDTRDLVISGVAGMSGSGVVSVLNGASITVSASGSLMIGDSITITGTGDSLINHGHLTISSPLDTSIINTFLWNNPFGNGKTPGTIDILSGKVQFGSGSNAGAMSVSGDAEVFINGTLTNNSSGTITMNGGAEIQGNGTLDNGGQTNSQGSTLLAATHTVIGVVFHNFADSGFLEIFADTLTLLNGGTNAGDINIHAGAVLRVFGTFTNLPTGVIHGGGVLDVSGATYYNQGAINPGSSPGTLTVVGNLNTSGTINIELAGLNPGTQYDRLLISESTTLGGVLNLSRLGGFIPSITDTFRFLTYGSRAGEFAAVTGTAVGNGTFLEIAYRENEIVQYVCNGVSDIQISTASILDTVFRGTTDTLTMQVCNAGHCPLVWSSVYEQHTPADPPWLTIVEGNNGQLERTLCKTMKVVINTTGLSPSTYSGDVIVTSNDPDQGLAEIPVQLVVARDHVDDLVISVNQAANSITLNWSSVWKANSYRIYQSNPSNYADPIILLSTTGDTTYTHTDILLQSDVTHLLYHVVASSAMPD
jgi:hypothetical protein